MSSRSSAVLLSAAVLFATGCGGGGGSAPSTPPLPPSPSSPIPSGSLVVSDSRNVVSIYPPGATTPLRSFTPSGQALSSGLAVDATGNVVAGIAVPWSPGPTHGSIAVFRGDATGSATSVRTINGPQTRLHHIASLAVDHAGDIAAAWIDDGPSSEVDFFAPTANGDVAPIRTLAPIYYNSKVAFDTNDDLIVAGYESGNNVIKIIPPGTVTGSAMTSSAAGLGGCLGAQATSVVTCSDTADGGGPPNVFTAVPGPGPSGYTVTRSISGASTTLVGPDSIPSDVAADAAGTIYVATSDHRVVIFAPGANGNVPPARIISVPGGIYGIAIAP